MEYQNLLVFVELPDPVGITKGLAKSLSYMDMTLVGYYDVDDSADLARMREEHEEEAQETLTDMATKFEEQGIRVTTEAAFGTDKDRVREEFATKGEFDGVLVPGEENLIGRVLVGLRDARNAERIADFIDFIDREKIIHITLIHVAPESDDADAQDRGRNILNEMKNELTERGVNPHAIDMEVRSSTDPAHELVSVAQTYDLVVLGKTEEGHESTIFGPVASQINDRSNKSVLIVR